MAFVQAARGARCTRSRAAAAEAVSRGRPAGYAGLLFAVFSFLSLWLLRDLPSTGASDAEITAYYAGDGQRPLVMVGLYLAPFAGITFCWFMAAWRDRIVRHAGIEDHLLSTMQLVSGVLFVAMTFATAAALASTALALDLGGADRPDPGTTRQLLVLGEALRMVFALRMAAVFMIAGTTRARRAGLLPHWLVVASYVGALILLFSASYAPLLALILPLWVAVVSVLILRSHAVRTEPVAA